MEQIDFKKTIDNLRKTGFNPVPNLVNIAIPDAKNILWQGLNYFTENAEWLPEYEEIASWLSGNNGRGLLCHGNCGRGKSQRTPGQIRTTQNWIGPRGCTIDTATFVPPIPEEVYGLLKNLYEYMNDEFEDPLLVNIALSHMQFETIHAYKDGNGRLGRALIPVQMAMLDQSTPILYMSEILELYKPSYQRNLMECRRGNVSGYIKFFLQCIIDQCNAYIYKLDRIKEIYKEDMKTIEAIKGNSVYKIMPVIMKQIVFTKKEIQELSGVSPNVVSKIINQLVDLNVIIPDSTKMKKGYRYQKIYEVFVGTREF